VAFILTNLAASSRAVVRFYNKRGTAEQWIKEGKQAVAMTRLSCHRFNANEVRLWLSVIAYNLGNLWRRVDAQRDLRESFNGPHPHERRLSPDVQNRQ
jgi:Transposase DDE domain group 1